MIEQNFLMKVKDAYKNGRVLRDLEKEIMLLHADGSHALTSKPWGYESRINNIDVVGWRAASGSHHVITSRIDDLDLSTTFGGASDALRRVYSSGFPIVIKYLTIIAGGYLSLQVHPTQHDMHRYGLHAYNNQPQKDEVWIVLEASDDAEFYSGLRYFPKSDQAMREMINFKMLKSLTHRHKARAGDAYVIPAGTLHGARGYMRVLEFSTRTDITLRADDEYGGEISVLSRWRAIKKRPALINVASGLPDSTTTPRAFESHCTPFHPCGVRADHLTHAPAHLRAHYGGPNQVMLMHCDCPVHFWDDRTREALTVKPGLYLVTARGAVRMLGVTTHLYVEPVLMPVLTPRGHAPKIFDFFEGEGIAEVATQVKTKGTCWATWVNLRMLVDPDMAPNAQRAVPLREEKTK